MKCLRPILIVLLFFCSCVTIARSNQESRPLKVAILDLGAGKTAQAAAERVFTVFSANGLSLLDRAESGPAARGLGYSGSLNLTLSEARDIGAAIGCEFFVIGDAQTLRRSSSTRPVYYESYASIFIVSARSGRLLKWDRPSFEATSPAETEKSLMAELSTRAKSYVESILEAERLERDERVLAVTLHAPLIEEVPDETSPQAKGVRLPQPYRRIRPTYPESAAKAEAIATVDVLVDLDSEGEVNKVEVVRWAGFGLDEETINTVRRMHFRPAMRDGVPFPMRVLLRYNYRPIRPKSEGEKSESDIR